MKNVTLSIDEDKLEEARRLAKSQNSSLNKLFRQWTESYIVQQSVLQRSKRSDDLQRSFQKFSIKSDKKYTREEMNER